MNTETQADQPTHEDDQPSHFIAQAIADDLAAGRVDHVHTRFPPEPNGYLHIGHAKAICIVFGLARQFDGRCNLRLDDTNPVKEEQEYIDSIKEDVRWLGFDWDNLCYASDYFDQLFDWARARCRRATLTSTISRPKKFGSTAAHSLGPASRRRSAIDPPRNRWIYSNA